MNEDKFDITEPAERKKHDFGISRRAYVDFFAGCCGGKLIILFAIPYAVPLEFRLEFRLHWLLTSFFFTFLS